ncbi:hypothetical protein [Streptomyces luteoverticillatus]|uniref:hypothetical protein n=1 Tax=Streptomyces luteoverticillatus TaxID=66425 RepID=UPI0026C9E06C
MSAPGLRALPAALALLALSGPLLAPHPVDTPVTAPTRGPATARPSAATNWAGTS